MATNTRLIPCIAIAFAVAGCGSSTSSDGSAGAGGASAGASGEAGSTGSAGTAGASGSAGAAGGPPDGYEVGFGVVDISPTPTEIAGGDLFMGAYGILGDRGNAIGVHDPVYARAMVVESGETVALAILDLPGIGNRPLHEIRDGVVAATGMDPDNVLVGATHSHSAPDLQGLWGGVPDSYRTRLIALTIDSIVTAFESRVPATLRVARGTHDNRNRRDWGFTDDELTVLDATDESGNRLGTLIQFAAHPVKVGRDNREVSRDWPGYTVDRAEGALGAPVLYFNGIIGDCSPDGGGGGFDGAETYGHGVADKAVSVLDQAVDVSPGLRVEMQKWKAPVTNQAFVLAYRAGILDYVAEDIPGDLGINTQAAVLGFGSEIQGVAFPGESVTRHGLPMKEPMKAPFRFFFGLTTDTLGYFIPLDEWQSGRNDSYEETLSMGDQVGDQSQQIVVDAVNRDNDLF